MSERAPDGSASEFYRWIVTQADRNDIVGDIAIDIKRDKDFPVAESTLEGVIGYLSLRTSEAAIHDAMREAFREFITARRS